MDEGQDLPPKAYDMLAAVAGPVTVAFDANQRLYERGASIEQIADILGLRSRGITFISTFRCSPYIARVAAEFIESSEAKAAFLGQVTVAQSEKEKPLVYFGLLRRICGLWVELDFSLSGHPGEENGDQSVPVSGIGIRVGAQVASLRCPILRADAMIIPRKFGSSLPQVGSFAT